jgi:hypothetical protein
MSTIESGQESENDSIDLEPPSKQRSPGHRTILGVSSMAEDLEIKNIQIREANKLDGASNY